MKYFTRLLFVGIAVFIVGAYAPFVSAVEVTDKSMRSVMMENGRLEQRLESSPGAKMENRAAKITERTERMNTGARNRINGYINATVKHMQAHIDRFTNIMTRLESRADEIENAQGADMTEFDTVIDTVASELSSAQEGLDSVKTDTATTETVENPRDALHMIREKLTLIKSSLKEAHVGLRDAVAILKQLREQAQPNTIE